MSVTVTCRECDVDFDVSSAKAGKTVQCPDCDTGNKVPRGGSGRSGSHPRPGEAAPRRPGAASSMSSTKVAMIGATVLVLGVLGMVTAKFLTTPDVEYPEDTISSGGSENSGTPVATGGETNSATTVPPSDTIAQSPGGSGIPVTPVTNSQSTAASATGVVDATDSDRGRRMMAKMSGVAINRASFFQDARGELGKAVDTGVRAALESCKLTYRAGVIEPVMNIRLEVRVEDGKKKLWMYAELLEKDGEETVRVWERKGSVVAVKDQALKSGLLPPNVDRDISRFFRSLRGDFDDARRQFTS